MKKTSLSILALGGVMILTSCNVSSTSTGIRGTITDNPADNLTYAQRDLKRSLTLTDKMWEDFYDEDLNASMEYYPYIEDSAEMCSVWHYTSIFSLLNRQLRLDPDNETIKTRHTLVVEGLEYYRERRNDDYRVYAVARGFTPGGASTGINSNVYDDNMWIAREFMEAYEITGEDKYLTMCREVIDYCLSGYDHTINEATGEEWGGIYWGPYYKSKHACSNGPIIKTLIKLSDAISENKEADDSYFNYAVKLYDFSYQTFKRSDNVYGDMIGTEADIDGNTISHGTLDETAYSYNSGVMISAGVYLYKATNDVKYLNEAKACAQASYDFFANTSVIDGYMQFPVSTTLWFNLVLMIGLYDLYFVDSNAATYLDAIQKSIDFAYNNYLYEDVLPVNWLLGFVYGLDKDNHTDIMDRASQAEVYALLAEYQTAKQNS